MSELVAPHLPLLRRYARALTGTQDKGDHHAAATLEAILADPSAFDASQGGKAGLFRLFHLIWSSSGAPVSDPDDALQARAAVHLAGLTPNSREALLLHTVEGFSIDEVGFVMGMSATEAQALLDTARSEMHASVRGRVLIIEDEAIIAMDLEGILASMGHEVTGIARTRDAAVKMGRSQQPDLILADIQLADNSSGIDAVRDLLADLEVPVIFITAFPERLLTGDRPEPTFLIAKPYTPEQVIGAVSQAMFFASTETLRA
jgi:DNA-directed RNA polymerase specialized sigma24 family protein/CheY-like chemotaxis protein